MRKLLLLIILVSANLQADTIDHYMNIAQSISKMEIKANPRAQAWARSARSIMILTCESIAQTMLEMNKTLPQPMLCPPDDKIAAAALDKLIQTTYKKLYAKDKKTASMSVSKIALHAAIAKYPCKKAI